MAPARFWDTVQPTEGTISVLSVAGITWVLSNLSGVLSYAITVSKMRAHVLPAACYLREILSNPSIGVYSSDTLPYLFSHPPCVRVLPSLKDPGVPPGVSTRVRLTVFEH